MHSSYRDTATAYYSLVESTLSPISLYPLLAPNFTHSRDLVLPQIDLGPAPSLLNVQIVLDTTGIDIQNKNKNLHNCG